MIIPRLEIRTLSLVTVLFALMHSFGLFMVAVSQRSFKGCCTLTGTIFCPAPGFRFIADRSYIPDFIGEADL